MDIRPLPVVGLLLLASCAGDPAPDAIDRLSRCTSEEGPTDAYCGWFEVPENRDESDGRMIALKVVLFPALSNKPEPDPLVMLAGGPGQGAASIAEMIEDRLGRLRRSRDLLLVDQRGTGESAPLDCEAFEPPDEFDPDWKFDIERAELCLTQLEGDPRFYTTPIAMQDLDEVRQWLGYEQMNLLGGSYGTRAALVYLRMFPEQVRTVILDGVAPPDMALPLFFARDAQRALDHMLEDCEAAPECREAYPNLRERARELFESPPRQIRFLDPYSGEPREMEASGRDWAGAVTGMLYSPMISSLGPRAIDRAADGDFGPLVALSSTGEGTARTLNHGMFYAVVCSEDARLYGEDRAPGAIERETQGTFLDRSLFDTRWKACEIWPRGDLPDDYFEPVVSDKPTLILSGEVDPVTPPSWGETVAEHLSRSRHIVAPGTGHGVMATGCGRRMIEQFLDSADPGAVNDSCLAELERPPFFLNDAGPAKKESE